MHKVIKKIERADKIQTGLVFSTTSCIHKFRQICHRRKIRVWYENKNIYNSNFESLLQ